MAEFPGFLRSKTIATAWINALTKQGKLMNDAWGNILAGNYGPKDALRDGAQMYQNHYDIIDALLPSDPASALNVPSWLMLDGRVKLSDTVQTRVYDNDSVNLSPSELVSLGGSDTYFDMHAEPAGPTSLRVTITALRYKAPSTQAPGTQASGRARPNKTDPSVTLNSPKDAIAAAEEYNVSGPYLGLVYDQRAVTNAPLAVVTFLI